MAFFTWSQDMSVGVDLIDSDHQALIGLINELHDALKDEGSAALPADTFDRLIEYVERHFVREEAVMQACDYPNERPHRVQHDRFTHEISTIRARYFKDDASEAADELLNFLKTWLRHHILVEDMAYRSYVEGNAEAIDVADNFGPGLNESMPRS
ncbi:MAG: bacteriohemerythrin [Alphaproteobacteria bacterium]